MIIKSDIKLFFLSFFIFFFIFFFFLSHNKTDKDNYNETVKKYKDIKDLRNINNSYFESSSLNENIEDEKIIRYREILNELKLQQETKLNENLLGKVNLIYIPLNLEKNLKNTNLILDLKNIILSNIFGFFELSFNLEFNKENFGIRGKYKDKTIKLFGVLDLKKEEIISVFIHELGHYIDIDYLEKKVLYDLSDKFYEISWSSTKTLKPGQKSSNFVSGYAMTNKYEDFAESFTYYVLHNNSFFKKASNDEVLKQKYDFFKKYIFRKNEFINTNFSDISEIRDYYWDITKIEISLQNLLNYFKN